MRAHLDRVLGVDLWAAVTRSPKFSPATRENWSLDHRFVRLGDGAVRCERCHCPPDGLFSSRYCDPSSGRLMYGQAPLTRTTPQR